MDSTALEDQAKAAASEYMDRQFQQHPELLELEPDFRQLMKICFAYGWVIGRAAGGDEAKAVINRLWEQEDE